VVLLLLLLLLLLLNLLVVSGGSVLRLMMAMSVLQHLLAAWEEFGVQVWWVTQGVLPDAPPPSTP
jgi:pyruvate-formate lyase-activating enzyme